MADSGMKNGNNPILQSIPSIIRAVHIFSGPFLLSAVRSEIHLTASFLPLPFRPAESRHTPHTRTLAPPLKVPTAV